ncbi:MAG: hypothetical protein AAGI38_13455 [Bacteroidota bacterium]
METLANTIELRITGQSNGTASATFFTGKEVAAVIHHFENALLTIIQRQRPEFRFDQTCISLVEVTAAGLTFGIRGDLRVVLEAFSMLTTSLNEHNFERVPLKAFEGIREIHKIAIRNRAQLAFYNFSISLKPIVALNPDDELKLNEELLIEGETTIYAKVLGVGGSKPNAKVETIQGQHLSFPVEVEQAKQLANRLYTEVALTGLGSWKMGEIELHSFQLTQIEPYQASLITTAVDELASLIGDHWDEIDPESYLQELRHD